MQHLMRAVEFEEARVKIHQVHKMKTDRYEHLIIPLRFEITHSKETAAERTVKWLEGTEQICRGSEKSV